MTIGYTRDERVEFMQRQKNAVLAQALRDGLVFALIVYAVITVIFSPGGRRR